MRAYSAAHVACFTLCAAPRTIASPLCVHKRAHARSCLGSVRACARVRRHARSRRRSPHRSRSPSPCSPSCPQPRGCRSSLRSIAQAPARGKPQHWSRSCNGQVAGERERGRERGRGRRKRGRERGRVGGDGGAFKNGAESKKYANKLELKLDKLLHDRACDESLAPQRRRQELDVSLYERCMTCDTMTWRSTPI